MEEAEITYWYPEGWDEEFRRTGLMQRGLDDYPHLFDGTRGMLTLSPDNKLFNLSTYALMYLLRRNDGIESLTYFRLCATAKSKDGRRERLPELVRRWMGNDSFGAAPYRVA